MYLGVRRAGEGQGGSVGHSGGFTCPVAAERWSTIYQQPHGSQMASAQRNVRLWRMDPHRPSSIEPSRNGVSVSSDFRVRSMVEPGHGRRTVRSTSKLSIVIERNESLSDEVSFNDPGWGRRYTAGFRGAIAARAPGDRGRRVGPAARSTGTAPAMIVPRARLPRYPGEIP